MLQPQEGERLIWPMPVTAPGVGSPQLSREARSTSPATASGVEELAESEPVARRVMDHLC